MGELKSKQRRYGTHASVWRGWEPEAAGHCCVTDPRRPPLPRSPVRRPTPALAPPGARVHRRRKNILIKGLDGKGRIGYNIDMSTTTKQISKSAKSTRKSPMQAAIVTAARAVTRMSRRKARTEARIERMRQRISNAVANAQQFDTLIQQLETNHAALCSMAAVIEGKA